MTIHIYQDRRGEYRWRAVRGGRIVADGGEGYTRRRDAVRAWSRFAAAMAAERWTMGD